MNIYLLFWNIKWYFCRDQTSNIFISDKNVRMLSVLTNDSVKWLTNRMMATVFISPESWKSDRWLSAGHTGFYTSFYHCDHWNFRPALPDPPSVSFLFKFYHDNLNFRMKAHSAFLIYTRQLWYLTESLFEEKQGRLKNL